MSHNDDWLKEEQEQEDSGCDAITTALRAAIEGSKG